MSLLLLCLLFIGISSSAAISTHAQTRAYVANNCADTVSVIDTAQTQSSQRSPSAGRQPNSQRLPTVHESTWLIAAADQFPSLIRQRTQSLARFLSMGLPGFISPDGARVYVGGIEAISVIDTNTNTVIATIQDNDVNLLAITPDGARVFVTNNQGFSQAVVVLDTTS